MFTAITRGTFQGEFFMREGAEKATRCTVKVLDKVGKNRYIVYDTNSNETAILHADALGNAAFIPTPDHVVE